MNSETKICQNCKQNFVIEPEDFDFYRKIDVPPPTWCPECTEDLANLVEASAGCDRVRAVAVNAGDSAEQVQSYLSRHALRLPVLRDPSGEAWRTLDGRGLPMNAYWSARGHETDLGPKTREQWKDRFAQLGCP